MPLGDLFTGPHLIILLLVLLVLFGATKLPIFAKGLGQSIKIFRKEMTDVQEDIKDDRAKRSAEHQDRDAVTVPDSTTQNSTTQTRRASEDR